MTKKGKLILCEAVQENTTPKYIKIGALSKAGLLTQYKKELEVYEHEIIKPTITANELDKIIKAYMEDK